MGTINFFMIFYFYFLCCYFMLCYNIVSPFAYMC